MEIRTKTTPCIKKYRGKAKAKSCTISIPACTIHTVNTDCQWNVYQMCPRQKAQIALPPKKSLGISIS